jgi:hypothetical protein
MMARLEFEKQLRALLEQRPFPAFVIELDDGQKFLIESRQSISYLTGDSALYFAPDDSWHFVDCDNVKKIVVLAAAESN